MSAFGGIFGFLDMGGSYESRSVGRHEYEYGFVSTAYVTDGSSPYETAVEDSRYADDMVIVEAYASEDDAKLGHAKWVSAMTTGSPPNALTDCMNSEIAQFAYDPENPPTWQLKVQP